MRAFSPLRVLPLIAFATLAGCAGADGPSPLTLPAVDVAPESSPLQSVAALAVAPQPVGSPTEVYTRVARGILTCWFGANGPLKPAYIYHAEADPPSKGGGSVIAIHSRDKQVADPRSIRAWRLAIVPVSGGAKLEIENRKLPEEFAKRLEGDVRRWAAADEGCGEGPVTAGWGSEADLAPTKKSQVQNVGR